MLRRLRAGASSAICLLFVFAAALPAAVPAPCPALEAARSDAQASSDSKAAELALEAASETCASPLAAPETATAPPAFDTEVEPNDAPNTPTAVFFYGGVAVIAGEINGAGDVDYFRIFPPGPARVWLQTDTGGQPKPGATSRDTVMDLYGVDGTTLIENDDDDGTGSGGDGTQETGLASSIAGRAIGPNAVYIRVRAFNASGVIRPYRLLVLLTESAGSPESESNNTAATADVLTPPLALVTGAIGVAGDADYYAMSLTKGSVFVVSADADTDRDGNGTDLIVELRNPADQLIQSINSSDTGSLESPASEAGNYTIPADGTYYVRVRHADPAGTGGYHLAAGTLLINPEASSLQVDAPGNGVWEPGETVRVQPGWSNVGTGAITMTGFLTLPTGPAGATYAVVNTVSDYGTILPSTVGTCEPVVTCASISVDSPPSRPAVHWDASVLELLSTDVSRTWELHIGASFADVPTTNPFYAYIEAILHNGITGGCSATTYCPGNPALRKQMAVFVLKALLGPTHVPPSAGGVFTDVPAGDSFAPWIEELYGRGVVAGCGPGPTYCPDNSVNRQQMAIFLLKTLEGSGYAPPPCTGVFADVPCSNPFAPWIEELFDRGIAAGCGNGNFCPANPTTRGQMAPFLSKTFDRRLYGP